MNKKAGKGITLCVSTLLYGALRVFEVIGNPIYILDIFMLMVLTYSIYLIKFKQVD
jgi:hypothetical protein